MTIADTRKRPGQFTGKWEVCSVTSVVLAANCTHGEAENLAENNRRLGYHTVIRRAHVPVPPDIAALDAGDDK